MYAILDSIKCNFEFMKYYGLELERYRPEDVLGKVDYSYHESKEKIGQLKLLLNEIAFIEYLKSRDESVSPFQVCGGAPGIHYSILAEMYPDIHFILYDYQPFSNLLSKRPNVEIRFRYVTQTTVKEFDPSGVFVSDMRSLNISEGKQQINDKNTHFLYDSIICRDMYDQLSFFYSSGCKNGMIKFKIPERMTSFNYISGKLWLQPYIRTNELRLLISTANQWHTYDGNLIDKTCQLVNNHWHKTELDLSDWSRGNEIEKYLKSRSIPCTWDVVALVDILLVSEKLKYFDKLMDTYKLKYPNL